MAEALPIAYLNGDYLPIVQARISPLDRGFLFGDAVYEVVPVYHGRPMLLDEHLQRLGRSLSSIGIINPKTTSEWQAIVAGLAERNGNGDLGIYLQVSRGADTGRDHSVPKSIDATIFGLACKINPRKNPPGIRLASQRDDRWRRCDIKATNLLANIMARQAAQGRNADEALLVNADNVTEGASSSVLILEKNRLIRRPNGEEILPGTTTDLVVDLAAQEGIACAEELISLPRLLAADEVWIASAMRGVLPVVSVDGKAIGDGQAGPVWQRVVGRYDQYIHDL